MLPPWQLKLTESTQCLEDHGYTYQMLVDYMQVQESVHNAMHPWQPRGGQGHSTFNQNGRCPNTSQYNGSPSHCPRYYYNHRQGYNQVYNNGYQRNYNGYQANISQCHYNNGYNNNNRGGCGYLPNNNNQGQGSHQGRFNPAYNNRTYHGHNQGRGFQPQDPRSGAFFNDSTLQTHSGHDESRPSHNDIYHVDHQDNQHYMYYVNNQDDHYENYPSDEIHTHNDYDQQVAHPHYLDNMNY